MNDITNKWKKTGLLYDLPEDQQEDCAGHLQRVANFLIERAKIDKDEELAGNILPIVRRMYDEGFRNNMPDAKWLCDDFVAYTKKSVLKKEDCYTAFDYEAELIAEYVLNLIDRKFKL